jgi:hypothetical protein
MKRHLVINAIAGLVLGGCSCKERPQSVCGDCLDNTGVHVDFSDPVDGQHPAALLFSGYRNDGCREDVLCTGTSSIYLGDVRWRADQFPHGNDLSKDCPKRELVAFVSGRSPTILSNAADFRFPSPASDWFDPPKSVKVTLWEVDATAWANHEEEARTARAIFEDLGTGITLDIWWPASPLVSLRPKNEVDFGNGAYFECGGDAADADPARARRLSPGYDETRINVYYVSRVRAPGKGWTCPDANNPSGPWNVIFIDRDSYPHTLAHELGHALGLNRSTPPHGGETPVFTGDIDELDMWRAFGDNNLMFHAGLNPTSLTVGQIYRMHFDVRSWLNKGPEVPGGYRRACQDSPVIGGPCPPLALSAPEGWP